MFFLTSLNLLGAAEQKIVVKIAVVVKIAINENRKAFKIADSVCGVESVVFLGSEKDQIAVTGEGIDPVELMWLLRKGLGYTELMSVGPVEKKKPAATKAAAIQTQPAVVPVSYHVPPYPYNSTREIVPSELREVIDPLGSSFESDDDVRICDCGMYAPTWISWTSQNPGRRFTGCPNWKDRAKKCHFFGWLDPPLSDHYKRLLLKLREKQTDLKEKEEALKKIREDFYVQTQQLKNVKNEKEKLKLMSITKEKLYCRLILVLVVVMVVEFMYGWSKVVVKENLALS